MASITVRTIIFLSLVLPQPISAIENITLNASLFANDNGHSWVSPSGEFAFGFQKLKNTSLYLLAIWFDKIPDKTIVWYANEANPAPQGSRVELTASGIVLWDPKDQQIWQEELVETVSYGAMLDTGNFVLFGSNSDYLWQSFNNPRDTILPSQKLELTNALFSRLTETNFSRGRFELYFSDGNLKLSPVAWPTESRYDSYFSSEISPSASASRLVLNESGAIYIEKMDGMASQLQWKNVSPIQAGNYCRATLDYNGVFTLYTHPRSSDGEQSWSIVRYIPENICWAITNDLGSGSCGYNSYCSIKNDKPTCTCPTGYSPVDPHDEFGGCKPNFPLGCGVDDGLQNLKELYEIRELPGVNWPLGDYERLDPYSESECESSCLQDCSCAVAIFGDSRCWKKRLPLANGRVEENAKALIRVRKGSPFLDYPDPPSGKACPNKSIFLGSLGSSLVLNVLLLISVSLIFLLKHNRTSKKVIQASSLLETNLHKFSYKELEEATDKFKEQVRRGSFGIVYKGILKFGANYVVAVKKLGEMSQDVEKEFRAELRAIGKTCHKNLVRLLGFCEEGAHRLLVYEFMSNGTLADFLFGIPKPDWNTRTKFALDVVRGLVYLHGECEIPIIHCDIKPQNVLLDEFYTARISDFGLAKLLISNQSRTHTIARGTRGYVAPEWFKNVAITNKVDVYSFGVMLLEIICCRKSVTDFEEEKGILVDWAYECFMNGSIDALVENDEEMMSDKDKVHGWVKIAILCIQEDPSNRPSMKMVMQMLEGFVEVLLPPVPNFGSSY